MSHESTRTYTLADLEAARKAGYDLGYAAGVAAGGGRAPLRPSAVPAPDPGERDWVCTGQPRPHDPPDGGWS